MGQVKLKEWFSLNQRTFPWREDRSPYRVWVSEVMLQQTRAQVVIDYFNAWMEVFPTLEVLANASEAFVMKQWEGLGYYKRARNLRLGAIYVMENYQGVIPDSLDKLLKINGLGPYTANAILSFAFQRRAPALDGNVMRVLARLLSFEKEVLAARKELEKKLIEFLPEKDPHIAMEALIELGATLCRKEPKCEICPLNNCCQAHHKREVHRFPIKKGGPEITPLFRMVACIECKGAWLLRRGSKGKVMEGLYEYPYIDCSDDNPQPSYYIKQIEEELGIPLELVAPLPRQKHHFTRYLAHLFPFLIRASIPIQVDGYEWVIQEKIPSLPFSAGHRRIMMGLKAD